MKNVVLLIVGTFFAVQVQAQNVGISADTAGHSNGAGIAVGAAHAQIGLSFKIVRLSADSIAIEVAETGEYRVELNAESGKPMHSSRFAGRRHTVSVSALPKGDYFVRLSSGKNAAVEMYERR